MIKKVLKFIFISLALLGIVIFLLLYFVRGLSFYRYITIELYEPIPEKNLPDNILSSANPPRPEDDKAIRVENFLNQLKQIPADNDFTISYYSTCSNLGSPSCPYLIYLREKNKSTFELDMMRRKVNQLLNEYNLKGKSYKANYF